MKTETKRNLLGQALILLITIAWGSSFIILKHTIEVLPPIYVISIRFLAAGILFAIVFFKKTVSTNKKVILHGVILGVFLAVAYITQTIGLKYISAGKNAFLTSLYCIMIPLIEWMLFKNKPKIYNIVSAVVCITGLAFIAFSGTGESDSQEILGSALTIFCAIFFGLQIIFSGKFQTNGDDTRGLLIYQLLSAGIIMTIVSAAYELPTYGISAFAIGKEQLLPILYLTLVCTFIAQTGQMVGIKLTSPAQTSLILAFEAAFGALFSIIAGEENLNVYLIIGFSVMFIGTMISEFKVDFLKLFKRRRKTPPKE